MKLPRVILDVPTPRLLPLTIVAMAALLGVKSVALVRAAAPAAATETTPAAPVAMAPVQPVTATKPSESRPPAAKPAEAKQAVAKPPDTATAPPAPPISTSERALLLDLRQRRADLDKRAAALTERENLLAAAEARLSARVAELAGLQKRLESLEAARKDREEANWRGLVKLYESMKPKDAAAIFNDLDLPVLLPVLDRMKARRAAQVLAAMLPERARLVTAELAEMRTRENAVPPATPAQAGAATPTAPGKPAGG